MIDWLLSKLGYVSNRHLEFTQYELDNYRKKYRNLNKEFSQFRLDNNIVHKRIIEDSDMVCMSVDLARELWFVHIHNMKKLRSKIHAYDYMVKPEGEPVEYITVTEEAVRRRKNDRAIEI